MFRRKTSTLEVLLVHPGGPFWAKKDAGSWSIPKGEYADAEDSLEAAQREFLEETGLSVCPPLIPLGTVKQPSGKSITVWAFESDCDPEKVLSNTFSIEWPPKSGTMATFPEVDRAGWFETGEAKTRILKGQVKFIEELETKVLGHDAKTAGGGSAVKLSGID